MDIISLDEALKIMEQVDAEGKPVPFSITAITCDLNRARGGERLTFKAAVLTKKDNSDRKAYHFRHNTRNIKGVASNQIRSIHPLLITHFNGKEVSI